MYGFENELEKAKKISEICNSNFYEYDPSEINLEEFQKRFISKELDPIYDIISPVVSSMIKFYQKETE